MIDWAAVKDAVRAWVVAGAALRGGVTDVVWDEQNGPRLAAPWIGLQVLATTAAAPAWLDVEDADVPAPGAEIELKSRQTQLVSLAITCYGGPAVDNTSAEAILDAVLGSHNLPSIKEPLQAAGVGLAQFEPVTSIGAVLGLEKWEPRATTIVRFYVAGEFS